MNIGFYGHSNCAYRGDGSYIDLLGKHYNASIVNIGVRQGSEERILFELKKTKDLDLAIIFHSEPQYIFLPGCDRDFGLNNTRESRLEYLFKFWNNNFTKQHHEKFIKKFETAENFYKIITSYKEYLYHPDLQANRFYGSAIQIDQYITTKNIKCIHILDANTFPNWFKFTSGIIDHTSTKIVENNQLPHGTFFPNNITKDGNIKLYNHLVKLIENS